MKYLIGLTFLLYSRFLSAQTADSFIGKWHVEHTLSPMNVPPKLQKQLNRLRVSYEGATFEFHPDAKFSLRSKDPKAGIENGYWIFDPATRVIKVCKWEDRQQVKPLLLELSARTEKDGSTYFSLHEAPVAFKVKKE